MVKNLILNGDELVLTGVTKIVSSSPTQSIIDTEEGGVLLVGTEMEVKKLNLEEKEVELFGKFTMIKFGIPTGKKPSLLKRIFK